MEEARSEGAGNLRLDTHTHAHAYTEGQKRYRISRKGPTKSCQVAFRLTFRVTASAARERTTAKYTGYPAPIDEGSGREQRKGAGRGEDFFPFLRVLFLFLGVVSLGEGVGDDGISELAFNLKSSIWIEWRVFR